MNTEILIVLFICVLFLVCEILTKTYCGIVVSLLNDITCMEIIWLKTGTFCEASSSIILKIHMVAQSPFMLCFFMKSLNLVK